MFDGGLLPRMPGNSFGLEVWPVVTGSVCSVEDWTLNRNFTAPCSLPLEITASTSCGFGFGRISMRRRLFWLDSVVILCTSLVSEFSTRIISLLPSFSQLARKRFSNAETCFSAGAGVTRVNGLRSHTRAAKSWPIGQRPSCGYSLISKMGHPPGSGKESTTLTVR